MSGLPIPVVQYRHCVFVYKSYLFSLCDASTDSFVDKSTMLGHCLRHPTSISRRTQWRAHICGCPVPTKVKLLDWMPNTTPQKDVL